MTLQPFFFWINEQSYPTTPSNTKRPTGNQNNKENQKQPAINRAKLKQLQAVSTTNREYHL